MKHYKKAGSCVRPFIENIEVVERLYNNSMSLIFNQEKLYLGVAESK